MSDARDWLQWIEANTMVHATTREKWLTGISEIEEAIDERAAMLECIAELAGALKRIKDTAATHTEGAGMPEFEVYMNIAGEAGNALTRAEQFLKEKSE